VTRVPPPPHPGRRRSRRRRRLWIALASLVVPAIAVTVALAAGSGGSSPTLPPASLPGLLTGPAPWPANVGDLRARLDALGLPALSAEGTALHIHQHLDVYVDGRRVVVPAGVGINFAEQFISPLHTHDTSGIVHVESPTIRTFTLGEFFAVWGVRLTPSCVGGYCAKPLHVYIGGKPYTGDARLVVLQPHEEIVLAYGTPPTRIPASYAFPPGL
jgi:hypothetical protein